MYNTFHLSILDINTLSYCHVKKCHYPNFTQGEKRWQEVKKAGENLITRAEPPPPDLLFPTPWAQRESILKGYQIKVLKVNGYEGINTIQTQVQVWVSASIIFPN